MAVRRGPIIALSVALCVAGVGVYLWRSIQGMQAQGHIAHLHALPGGQEAVVTLEYTGRNSRAGFVARVGLGGTRWYAHLPAPPAPPDCPAALLADEELVLVRSVEPIDGGWRHHLSAYDAFDGEPRWTTQRDRDAQLVPTSSHLVHDGERVLELTPQGESEGIEVRDVRKDESWTVAEGLGSDELDRACLRGTSLTLLHDDDLVTVDLGDGTRSRVPLSRGVQGQRRSSGCAQYDGDFVFTLPGSEPGLDTRFVRASPDGEVQFSVGLDGDGRWHGPMAPMTPIWMTVEGRPNAGRLVMLDLDHGEPAWTGLVVEREAAVARVETALVEGHPAMGFADDERIALFDGQTGRLVGGQRLPDAGPLHGTHVGGASLWRFTRRDHGFGELPWLRLAAEHLAVLEQGHPETVTQDVTMEMADELGVPDERIGGQ